MKGTKDKKKKTTKKKAKANKKAVKTGKQTKKDEKEKKAPVTEKKKKGGKKLDDDYDDLSSKELDKIVITIQLFGSTDVLLNHDRQLRTKAVEFAQSSGTNEAVELAPSSGRNKEMKEKEIVKTEKQEPSISKANQEQDQSDCQGWSMEVQHSTSSTDEEDPKSAENVEEIWKEKLTPKKSTKNFEQNEEKTVAKKSKEVLLKDNKDIADIKATDMNMFRLSFVLQVSILGMTKKKTVGDCAKYIKARLEKDLGGVWIVVVGTKFGSYLDGSEFTKETFAYFYTGPIAFLVFQTSKNKDQ